VERKGLGRKGGGGGGVGVRGEVKEEFERNMDTKGPWSTIATQVFALEEDVVLEVPPNF